MFKEAISGLASSIFASGKKTISAYKPTGKDAQSSFERIAQQGIANLSFRSPILADIAQTMLHNLQLEQAKREQIRDYVKSDKAAGFRADVTKNMGGTPSAKQVDAEMRAVLDKITKSIEKSGIVETKKSELFKTYESYIKDFIRDEDKSAKQTEAPTGSGDDHSEVLARIEANTKGTNSILSELTENVFSPTGSGDSKDPNTVPPPVNKSASFIDPITGMPSINAAIGSIGSNFLSKVFDEETIERFASKTKKFFSGIVDEFGSETDSKSPEPVQSKTSSDVKNTESKTSNVLDEIVSKNSSIDSVTKTDSTKVASEISSDVKNTESKTSNVLDEIVSKNDSINSSDAKNTESKTSTNQSTNSASNTKSVKYPKKVSTERISDILGSLTLDLTGTESFVKKESTEDKKESDTVTNKNSSKSISVQEKTVEVQEKILEQITKLNNKNNVSPASENNTESALSKIGDKLFDKVGKKTGMGNKISSTLSRAGSLVRGVGSKIAGGLAGALNGARLAGSYIPKVLSTIAGSGASVASTLAKGAATVLPAIGSAASTLASGGAAVAGTVAKGVAGAIPAIGSAISAAGPAALVAGAGTAGYAAGKYVVNPLINSGIEAATGKKGATLGSWISDNFKSDAEKQLDVENKKFETRHLELMETQKVKKASQIQAMSDEKQTKDVAMSKSNSSPIIVQTNSSEKSNSSGPPIMQAIASSVRNQDSTFERVQMQDFWGRTA